MSQIEKIIHISVLCVIVVVIFVAYEKWLNKKALSKKITQKASWHDVEFHTGDVLLYSGVKTPAYHYVFKLFLRSPVHHIGVVYVEPGTNKVYVWELFEGGPRIALLKDINSRSIKYAIAVRQWNRPDLFDTKEFHRLMNMQLDNDRMFNFNFLGIFGRRMTGQTEKREEDELRVTCAMFTDEIFQHFGLFHSNHNNSMMLPPDYLKPNLPYAHRDIYLLPPVHLLDL
jgi:hypothetical protein